MERPSDMKIVIYQNPIAYKSKDDADISKLNEFIHSYLADGGDPRRVHKACPELQLDSEILLTLSLEDDITPFTQEESEQNLLDEEAKNVTS